jgi:DNA-binding NtrC family response regulator
VHHLDGSPRRALVVDDEPSILRTVADALQDRGVVVEEAADGTRALAALHASDFDVVVTDLRLPGADGLQVLRAARQRDPRCGVVVITAFGDVRSAVQAMREGAHHYLTKPFDLDELVLQIERIFQAQRLQDELELARRELREQRGARPMLIARSTAMQRLLATLRSVAATEACVLITGESGTGKELLARTVHHESRRHAGPLVTVNCAAIPEALAEAELFGAERGAFTGALERRDGRFLAAHQGTLFLDEVGDLPLPLQAKLLRALEEGVVQRLGSAVPIPVNVRVIAATHRDLAAMVQQGSFRQDLFYRLNVLSLQVPALRERVDDIPALVQASLTRFAPPGTAPHLLPAALDAMLAYSWPGNVRQLQNAVQRALIAAGGQPIDRHHLPPEIVLVGPAPAAAAMAASPTDSTSSFLTLHEVLARAEAEHIAQAIAVSGGNRGEAARLLGISRKHLWHKLRQTGSKAGDASEEGET